MDFTQFINPDVLILVVVIYALGVMFKNVKKIPDWIIPFVLLAIAIIFCIFLIGFNINAFIQGILVTAVAVYGNQMFKQLLEGLNVPKQ